MRLYIKFLPTQKLAEEPHEKSKLFTSCPMQSLVCLSGCYTIIIGINATPQTVNPTEHNILSRFYGTLVNAISKTNTAFPKPNFTELINVAWHYVRISCTESRPESAKLTLTTDIHASGGIRTHNLSRRAAADLRLRPRGHWDRPSLHYKKQVKELADLENFYTEIL
jgi:hypothetical protein